MGINRIGAKRGEIQRGTGNTQSLQDIAEKAADKLKQHKIIGSFTKSLEHHPALKIHPDVRRILELAESSPAQAVDYIRLLAKRQPLPAAESNVSGRKTGEAFAIPEDTHSEDDQLAGIRYETDENGLSAGNEIY